MTIELNDAATRQSIANWLRDAAMESSMTLQRLNENSPKLTETTESICLQTMAINYSSIADLIEEGADLNG